MLLPRLRRVAGILLPGLLVPLSATAAEPSVAPAPAPGLALAFIAEGGKATDATVASGVALFVGAGQPASPFLTGGAFSAVWEGFIHAELRGRFQFDAALNGSLQVDINGATVLEGTNTGGALPLSQPVALNKGANAFKATFKSPTAGDAWVRLGWTEKPPFTTPIPAGAFTHRPTEALAKAAQLRQGRELFLEHRCVRCHAPHAGPALGIPELVMDAPAFEGIGARRQAGWMARWILDPKALRSSARMPKLLRGPDAKTDADAIAAYLASLKTGGEVKLPAAAYRTRQTTEGADAAEGAKPLFERLHCAGCHSPPDAAKEEPGKISLRAVGEKFPPGKLAEFLRAPEAHFAWTRMPNFHLSAGEAKELESHLLADAPKPVAGTPAADAATLERGRKLVQTTGCLNCHSLKLENQFKAPPVTALFNRHRKDRSAIPKGDCLGAAPVAEHGFTREERAALEAFTVSGEASLQRHVPAEFAERQKRLLQCSACHGQIEGFPPLDLLGDKLRPEWMEKLFAGAIPHKLRFDRHPRGEPWLEARMPAFQSRAAFLAEGLAAMHGHAPKTPPDPPVDAALAETGRKLVGKDGGFSCVSCHAVGPLLAMEVFESEGLNLAWSADRLHRHFYRRWFRNPLSIDPQTKMPMYFEDGKSPLTDLLDGDAEKQIDAVWHYLLLRDKMTPPKAATE